MTRHAFAPRVLAFALLALFALNVASALRLRAEATTLAEREALLVAALDSASTTVEAFDDTSLPPLGADIVALYFDDYGAGIVDTWSGLGTWTRDGLLHTYIDPLRGKETHCVSLRPPKWWAYAPRGSVLRADEAKGKVSY